MQPPNPDYLETPTRATVNRPLDAAGNRYLHALCRAAAPAARVAESVERLGAEVNAVNGDGYTPLRYAIEYGDAESVALLLRKGAAPVYTAGGKTYNAVTAAVLRGREDILAAVLSGNGAQHVNAPGIGPRGETDNTPALVLAVQKGYVTLIPLLAAAGAELNRPAPPKDYTPLMQAADNGNTAAMRALLRAGADINARGAQGQTPLHIAAAQNDYRHEIATAFATLGADLEARNDRGQTPLMVAVAAGRRRIAAALIAAGAKVDARNAQQGDQTALMIAAREGDTECVTLLLKSGADPLLCDRFNRTAAHHARENSFVGRGPYDHTAGFSAAQPKTMLIEAENKAAAQRFEREYRTRTGRRGRGP